MLVDVETMTVAFLRPVVDPVRVATAVPATRPAELVRVFRTGGAAENRVLELAQVTVQCWAANSVRASQIAQMCRHAFLNDYTRMPLVRGVLETGGLYFDPDPATGIPRYTFTMQLSVRAKR